MKQIDTLVPLSLSLLWCFHDMTATSKLLQVLLVHSPSEDVLLVVAPVPVAGSVMVNTLGPHALAVAGPIALVAGHPGVVLQPLLLPVPGVKAQPVPGVVVGGVGHPVDHSSLLLTHTRLATIFC